ncbi:MAG: redoxin domain-containing protein [Pirellula sp.]
MNLVAPRLTLRWTRRPALRRASTLYGRLALAWIGILSICTPVAYGQNTTPENATNGEASPTATELQAFWQRPDVRGQSIPALPSTQVRVIAFLGCDCPVAKLYAKRLQELASIYTPRGVQWIGVMSNLQDTPEDIVAFCDAMQLEFPFLHDADQQIAKAFHATRTAEVIVLANDGSIVYRGRIDDQYSPGIKRSQSTQHELRDALDAALAGQPPRIPTTEPVGCLIAWEREPDATDVTFASPIANILYQHCYECHRPGEIGPFDISNPSEIQGWASMILEVIDQGRMPPWHADPAHGQFKNARSMSKSEMETIRTWVRAGAPLGDREAIPKPPALISGWRMNRDPDLVVGMDTAYRIPATGSVDYQYFVVDPGLTEDRWVEAAQVIPGDPSVVHHAIVFVRPPDEPQYQLPNETVEAFQARIARRDQFLGIGWLTAYVPGQVAMQFPPGYARWVPKGSKFVFQMHYTPNGQETTDRTKIGICFVDDEKVQRKVFTLIGIDQDFEIPPNAARHSVSARVPNWPSGAELMAVSPHMHLRGREFELRASRGDASEILLKVPRYDFNWQHTYEFREPIPMDSLDALEFTATFDNSTDNPFNPAPQEYVMWGDQTWEEMAVAFFEVSADKKTEQLDRFAMRSRKPAPSIESNAALKIEAKAVQFAEDYIKSLDLNRDGKVSFDEAPRMVQYHSFYLIDQDGDRKLSREELIEEAKRRLHP